MHPDNQFLLIAVMWGIFSIYCWIRDKQDSGIKKK